MLEHLIFLLHLFVLQNSNLRSPFIDTLQGTHVMLMNWLKSCWKPEIQYLLRVRLLYTYVPDFIMFSVITNIYNKKTKGPTLMELFAATGKLKKFFFDN